MDTYVTTEMCNENILLIVACTYGNGFPPGNGAVSVFSATRANECLTDLLFFSRFYQRVSKSF